MYLSGSGEGWMDGVISTGKGEGWGGWSDIYWKRGGVDSDIYLEEGWGGWRDIYWKRGGVDGVSDIYKRGTDW
jgi:hypothetical protein